MGRQGTKPQKLGEQRANGEKTQGTRHFRSYPPEIRQVVGETQTSPSGAQVQQEGRGGNIRPPRADGSPGGRGRGRRVFVNARGSVRVPGVGTS